MIFRLRLIWSDGVYVLHGYADLVARVEGSGTRGRTETSQRKAPHSAISMRATRLSTIVLFFSFSVSFLSAAISFLSSSFSYDRSFKPLMTKSPLISQAANNSLSVTAVSALIPLSTVGLAHIADETNKPNIRLSACFKSGKVAETVEY